MNNQLLLVATRRGVIIFERTGNDWRESARGLTNRHVTSIIARQGMVLAGTTDGIFRSKDFGKTWDEASTGLATRYVRWMAFHPDISDLEFAGTEPANIFVSQNGAASWRACPEVAQLRDGHKWFLPYSSGAGCVRGFAFHGARAYAAVEVGGVLRSDDRGETWQLAEGSTGNPSLGPPPAPFIYPDVHSIATHSSSPDRVFAPTGGGYYHSLDGGKTWELLYDCYVRALWIDPHDPAHQILGPAESVDEGGRIEETRDAGKTWQPASQGLSVPWKRHMVERFIPIDDGLLAVLSNGTLIAAPLNTLSWRPILSEIKDATAATTME